MKKKDYNHKSCTIGDLSYRYFTQDKYLYIILLSYQKLKIIFLINNLSRWQVDLASNIQRFMILFYHYSETRTYQ